MKKDQTSIILPSIRSGILFIIAFVICVTLGNFFWSSSKAKTREIPFLMAQNDQLSKIQPAKSFVLTDSMPFFNTETYDDLWQEIAETMIPGNLRALPKPKKYLSIKLNTTVLEEILERAPLEFTEDAGKRTVILHLPLPDGKIGRFSIKKSPMMSDEMQAQFPEIKNYSGHGVDDTNATMRFSWTPQGLNVFVITKNGSFMITPYAVDNREYYLSYFTRDTENKGFECLTRAVENIEPRNSIDAPVDSFTGPTFRQYRLITSSTAQFYSFAGGTNQAAINTMNTLISSINVIYEREATIRLNFQGWYVDPQGVVYPANQNPAQMAEINQSVLDGFFGNGNYDVGHVFGFNPSSPSGQVNAFSAVCNPPVKAKGATIVTPDLYQSTVVFAHEMGHLFNARHTFTPVSGSCSPASDPLGRVEPGSGSTIMSYAGICPPENLQVFNDDYFHVASLLKIVEHVDNVVPACGIRTATGNSPPTITGATGVNATIPANTPFTLTAFATDPNGDAITYDWEQIDSGNGLPILRSYYPTTGSSRTFPSLPFVLNNANVPPTFINGYLVGEILPSSTRTLNFAVTTRDNRAQGGTSAGSLQIFVRGDAGPFTVTQPNTNVTWGGASQQTVTWNVANTNLSPINTANVRILLSTNGGQTFPTVLLDSTPNDGSQIVTLPTTQTNAARIKVEAVNNIYFDVSNANFTIGASNCSPTSISIGQTVNGNLQSGDCLYTDNSLYDAYTFSGTAGQQIYITMNSSQFNAYLLFYQGSYPGGTLLTQNDNGGGGTNARIPPTSGFYTLPATATYTILANSLSAGETGAYTLFLGTNVAPTSKKPFDFDGDGKTDISIYRPSNGQWWINRSSNSSTFAVTFGNSADKITPVDFTGDGKTDIAFFRPSDRSWYILRSENFTFYSFPFGISTDVPAPGDFDGDGRADAAVFRPSSGTWYIFRSSDNGTTIQQFGASGDIPVVANYDGDSRADIAIYRPSTGVWWLNRSTLGVIAYQFGNSSDKPAPGDYTGDGKADAAFFRPSNGNWFILRSENQTYYSGAFGQNGDIPVPGDYDGDGRHDPAVFRPSNSTWYVQRSTNINNPLILQFGSSGDKPVPSAFVP